jgi:hypothetical protein
VSTSGHFETVCSGRPCVSESVGDHDALDDVSMDDGTYMDCQPQVAHETGSVMPASHTNLLSWSTTAVPLAAGTPRMNASGPTIPPLQFYQLQTPEPVKRMTSRRLSDDMETAASPRSSASSSTCFSTSPVSPFVKVFPGAVPPAAVFGQPSFT